MRQWNVTNLNTLDIIINEIGGEFVSAIGFFLSHVSEAKKRQEPIECIIK